MFTTETKTVLYFGPAGALPARMIGVDADGHAHTFNTVGWHKAGVATKGSGSH